MADQFVFNKALTGIAFDFKTGKSEDGLNFAVDAAATQVRFTLAIDGQSAPQFIRVGRDGDHPAVDHLVASHRIRGGLSIQIVQRGRCSVRKRYGQG